MVIFIIIAINLEMIDRNFSHVIKLLRISIFFQTFRKKFQFLKLYKMK